MSDRAPQSLSSRTRLALAFAMGAALSACREQGREPPRELSTELAALRPGAAPAIPIDPRFDPVPSSSACPEVERQARSLAAELPIELDPDTRATAVTARGCDLTLEYELSTLAAPQVSVKGLRAMRGQVTDRLCTDRGALGVMQRGGRITNVYYDRDRATIGLFTVAADDCGI